MRGRHLLELENVCTRASTRRRRARRLVIAACCETSWESARQGGGVSMPPCKLDSRFRLNKPGKAPGSSQEDFLPGTGPLGALTSGPIRVTPPCRINKHPHVHARAAGGPTPSQRSHRGVSPPAGRQMHHQTKAAVTKVRLISPPSELDRVLPHTQPGARGRPTGDFIDF